eukprot:9480047-Pyramimonas_sp.AAC.1
MQQVYPDRWGSSRQYEFCVMTFKQMKKLVVDDVAWPAELVAQRSTGDLRFWDVFVARFMRDVDFADKQNDNHQPLWVSFHNVMKTFKNYPELCLDMMMMLCPQRSGQVLKNPLLQQGMASPVFKVITSDMVACFTTLMAGSATAKQLTATTEDTGATGKKRKMPAERSSCINNATFVDTLIEFRGYLDKIIKNTEVNNTYLLLCCVAAMQEGIKLDGIDKDGVLKPGIKIIKGFASLRKIIKTEAYRRAKLRPRLSDVDFAQEKEEEEPSGQSLGYVDWDEQKIEAFLVDNAGLLDIWAKCIMQNNPTNPIRIHMGATCFINE